MIQSVRFNNTDQTGIVITLNDGREISGHYPSNTRWDKQVQAWLDQGNKIAPPVAPDYHAEARAAAISAVVEYRAIVTGGASAAEQAGWARKADAAARYSLGTNTEADTLLATTEAQARNLGETSDDLFALWLAKDTQYMKALGLLDGMKASALTRIDAERVEDLPALLKTLRLEAEQILADYLQGATA